MAWKPCFSKSPGPRTSSNLFAIADLSEKRFSMSSGDLLGPEFGPPPGDGALHFHPWKVPSYWSILIPRGGNLRQQSNNLCPSHLQTSNLDRGEAKVKIACLQVARTQIIGLLSEVFVQINNLLDILCTNQIEVNKPCVHYFQIGCMWIRFPIICMCPRFPIICMCLIFPIKCMCIRF